MSQWEEQEFGEAICNWTNKISEGRLQLYLIIPSPFSFLRACTLKG